jgi:hypothetical protein
MPLFASASAFKTLTIDSIRRSRITCKKTWNELGGTEEYRTTRADTGSSFMNSFAVVVGCSQSTVLSRNNKCAVDNCCNTLVDQGSASLLVIPFAYLFFITVPCTACSFTTNRAGSPGLTVGAANPLETRCYWDIKTVLLTMQTHRYLTTASWRIGFTKAMTLLLWSSSEQSQMTGAFMIQIIL